MLNRKILSIAIVAVVGAVTLFGNWSVTRSAEKALADYAKTGALPPDLDKLKVAETAPGAFVLVDMRVGKIVREPLVFRDRDAGVLAVREGTLVRLSGNVLQNLLIWVLGPMKPA